MFEAILSDDAKYDLPDHFTSRSAEVAQVYFKSLGVRMDTVIDDEEFIGYFEDKNTLITYQVHQSILVITVEQRRLLKKVQKAYRKYLKKYPNMIDDFDHIWDWIMDHITMHNKKKLLNGDIKKLFRENLTEFTQDCKEKVI